ncbi:MAG TPA: hypothetical protein VMS71_06125 [Candidatus Acidoferrum sp.]|nr:hypothetical protein [Candidatus Acidoferrum sp.]
MKSVRITLAVLLTATTLYAGPPFVTDDPAPVELHHWELYLASQLTRNADGSAGTLPHIEINYGVVSDVQLHLIVARAFNRPPGGPTDNGLGDIEAGVKLRFIQESNGRSMAGIFPMLEIPTGSESRGLGSGHLQAFLPIWLQKSWNEWTSYGGGGYFINPGDGHRNYWLAGWEIQRTINNHLFLGGELFGTTPDVEGSEGRLNFSAGGQIDLNSLHHVLFSAGRSISGDSKFQAYFGYQLTFGPKTHE